MAPSEKLTYFDLGAKGQFIRLCYIYGGIEFEDDRVSFADWGELKPKTPLGQLPVFQYDGKKYAQSAAILRFVGARAGLYPTPGTKEQLLVDSVVETITEAWSPPPVDERRKFMETKVKMAMNYIEAVVTENSGDDAKFVLGDKISIADVFLYGIVHFFGSGFLENISADDFADYKVVQRIIGNVKADPKLKDHIAAGKV